MIARPPASHPFRRRFALLPLLLFPARLPALGQDPARPSGGAPPSDDAFRMGSPPALPEGMSEEQMWPAATAEGWRQPCLVHWQRSFADALSVARAEHKPILVAVNMDGEIASEHFAGVRYREPGTAEQMNRYACVIASVYRHTPRDYDEEGRRIECPRFQTVTCGEHIEAERELYGKYFDGKRISPRHIVLDLEGRETYDVYYSWDTATVFTTFAKGVEGWPQPDPPRDRSLFDLAQSADVLDREALERAYAAGDRDTKRALLESLAREHVVDQVELLRAAVFDFDLELAGLARRALAQCESEPALDLMAEALKVPLEPADKELLLGAVERLGARSPRARTLAALHSGLALESEHIDAPPPGLAQAEYEASSSSSLEARERVAHARPEDPGALLELAEALVVRALESTDPRYARLLLEDARATARAAEERGAGGARLDAVGALLAAGLGDLETARARAVAAVEGELLRAQDGAGASTLAPAARTRLLRLFADARERAIRAAFKRGEEWPAQWLSDVSAAYAQVAADPAAGAAPLADYYDFLRWLGATPRANTVLEDALARFPDSPELHERLRARLLFEGGPEALERGYAERLAQEQQGGAAATQLGWFAGYASLVAAEHRRRRGEFEQADAAYLRGIARYEEYRERHAGERDNADHFLALAHAGRARLALERGALDAATDELLAGLRLRPESAGTPDGLGLTPIATAKMLHARLAEAGDAERAELVQRALDELPPELLEPPPSEQTGPPRRRGERPPGGAERPPPPAGDGSGGPRR